MTQTQRIRAHLEAGKPIDPLLAMNRYKIMRLAPRIEELRRAGLPIVSRIVTSKNGARFARYRLPK
jgi:hypothetical protein